MNGRVKGLVFFSGLKLCIT